jgi:hypothetical protein
MAHGWVQGDACREVVFQNVKKKKAGATGLFLS